MFFHRDNTSTKCVTLCDKVSAGANDHPLIDMHGILIGSDGLQLTVTM